MKILISGATGFVGRALCEALSREGHELVTITRDAKRARSLIPAPHQALEWDFSIQSAPKNLDLLENTHAVIHFAGEPILEKRWNPSVEKSLYNSRVSSTRNLIALLETNCKRFPEVFITASAIGLYGDRGSDILEETAEAGNDFLARICTDWEQALFKGCNAKTRKIALRMGIVLGEGGGALEKMLHPFSLGLGGPLGKGSQWTSWIHIDDLVSIVQECLSHEAYTGSINCCAPNPVTNLEFTAILAKHLNTKAIFPIPKIALQLAYGKASQVLISSQRISSTKLLTNNYQFKYPTLDSALSAILDQDYSRGYSKFYKKCWLPLPIEAVFKFFSQASNLEKITPPWLNFRILSAPAGDLKQGSVIDYRLKIHKVPLFWRTEISSWNPPCEFTDTQIKGPYQFWQHTHSFSALGSGTLMKDKVIYRLPMGYIGRVVAGAYVRNDVAKIFSYRNDIILNLNQHEEI